MDDRSPFIPTRIQDLNDDDKPREKALANGIRSLSDAELVALIFGGGLPGMSVVDMARSILHDCDQRVDNLARMGMQEMMAKYKGVGPAKAVCLAAAFELGRRNREQLAAAGIPGCDAVAQQPCEIQALYIAGRNCGYGCGCQTSAETCSRLSRGGYHTRPQSSFRQSASER